MLHIRKETGGNGVTFVELLQLAFIVLKLCKVIDWSWWLVLMPTWFTIGLVIIIYIVYKIKTR